MPNMEGFEPGLEEVPTTADDQAEREPTATELHERMLNIDLLVQHCNDLLPEDMVRHNVQVILLDEAKRLLKQMHEIEGRTSRDHSANIGSNRPFA